MTWKIVYYESVSKNIPVKEFIDSLPRNNLAKVFNSFELLSEFGIRLGSPHVKKVVSTPLWELRILGKASLRFFYIAIIGKTFLLLHGFAKKTQKTPNKEIKTALERLKDYKNRN